MRPHVTFEYLVDNGKIKKSNHPLTGSFISFINFPVIQDNVQCEIPCGVVLNEEGQVSFVPKDKIIWQSW